MTTRTLALAAAAMALFGAVPAVACPEPALPPEVTDGESEAAYRDRVKAVEEQERVALDASRLKRQQRAWDNAPIVMLARIDRIDFIRDVRVSLMQRATLTPVTAIKGAMPKHSFKLADLGETSCGIYGGGDATGGEPGDLIVVYLLPGLPSSKTMVDSIALGTIRDPRVTALLPKDR